MDKNSPMDVCFFLKIHTLTHEWTSEVMGLRVDRSMQNHVSFSAYLDEKIRFCKLLSVHDAKSYLIHSC